MTTSSKFPKVLLRQKKATIKPTKRSVTELHNDLPSIRKLANVYMCPAARKTIRVSGSKFCRSISVCGQGLDGETQHIQLWIKKTGLVEVTRVYGQHAFPDKGSDRLPVNEGKLLAALKDLGFRLEIRQNAQAVRYTQYVSTGISNLGRKDLNGILARIIP